MTANIILEDTQHAYSCTHCHKVVRCSHDSPAEAIACTAESRFPATANLYGCYECNALFWPNMFGIRLAGPPVIGALYREAQA